MFSLFFAFLFSYALTVVYAAWAGQLIDSDELLLGLSLGAAVVLPILLGLPIKAIGPRLMAALNLLILGGILFFAGEGTDTFLARNGARVFHPLGDSPAVTGTASLTVDALRFAARHGGPAPVEIDERPTDGGVVEGVDGGSPWGVLLGGPTADGGSGPVDGGGAEGVPDGSVSGGAIEPAEDPADGGGPGGLPDPVPGDPEVLVIPIDANGSTFDVGALVNGKPTSFVFDSGAHDVSITSALARRLGLSDADAIDWRVYRTANGQVRQPVVIIDSIDLGEGFVVEKVEGSICRGCSDNLLGRSFQKHFLIEIDSKRAEVRLRRN
ncbi:MAG: retropepsin-like aspartic protease [Deltaproteobacteria bacterium]|nr:retropepsin-like aspartic protease [Deltaproteobacteria bacterium]